MEKAVSYFRHNLTMALRSLRYNRRRYIPFFIAVILSQLCFGTLFSVNGYAAKEEKRIIGQEYDYHIEYSGFSESQVSYLYNYSTAVSRGAIYTLVEYLPSGTADGVTVYSVRIFFRGNAEANYKQFRRGVLAAALSLGDGQISYYLTPLFTGAGGGNNAATLRLALIFSAVTLLMLTVLYIIRINNFRFEYGIYMTCGADFRRLTEGSAFEMALIVLTCYLPSMAVSAAAGSLICRGVAVPRFAGWVVTLAVTLAVSLISVIFPMFAVSRIYPVKNIAAADNSNYASSPRRSAEMLGHGVRRYQRISFVRFRKYFIRATAAAASFSVCASVLYYTSFISRDTLEAPGAQFTLSFLDGTEFDAEVGEQLAFFDGIEAINRKKVTNAAVINTVVAFDRGDVVPFSSGFVSFSRDGHSKYTNCVDYSPIDSGVAEWLSRYEHTGDIELGMTEGYCVIAQNRYNRRMLDLKPGDEIYIASATGRNLGSKVTAADIQSLTGDRLLSAKLDFYTFTYKTLTVAAVIENMPTFEMIPLYMSAADYRDVTYVVNDGSEGLYTRADIYCGGEADTEALDRSLRQWASVFGSVTVKNNHYAAEKKIESARHMPQMLAVLGIFTAVAAPVIWAFSETVFYGKRRDEFLMLRWLGGTDDRIRRLHIADAGLFAALSAVFTAVFSLAGIGIAYRTANLISGTALYHEFRFPAALYFGMILLSALGSAAAVMISYIGLVRSSASGDLTDDS